MSESDLRSSEVLVQIQNRQTIMTEFTNSQILTDEDPYAPNRQSVQPKQVSQQITTTEQEESEDEFEEDNSYHALSAFSELRKRYKVISSQRANGKMISNEADEIVEVKSRTYTDMVKAYGGPVIVIAVNVVMCCFMVSAVYSNNVLLQWANQPAEV